MRKASSSVWVYLLTAFAAVGLAVAVLPGCGDDTRDDDDDSDSESQYIPDSDSDSDSQPS
jgi:hypothetical protein